LPGIAHTDQQTEFNQTSLNGRKQIALTICRKRVWSYPSRKIWSKNLCTWSFFNDFNAWWRMSPKPSNLWTTGKGSWNYKGVFAVFRNFV